MNATLRVPLLPGTELPSHYVRVGTTEYKISEADDAESLNIVISPACVAFNEDSLKTKFGHLNTDKVHFTEGIKSFMLAYDGAVLKSKSATGKVDFKLNEQEVSLVYRQDYWLSVADKLKK